MADTLTLDQFTAGLDPGYTFTFESPHWGDPEVDSFPAYVDSGGTLTAGFGSTRGITPETVLSRGEAEEMALSDYKIAAASVLQDVDHKILGQLAPDARMALIDLAFNAGPLRNSAPNALAALNAGDFETFESEAFSKEKGVVNIGDEISSGLLKRRNSNREMFQAGTTPKGETSSLMGDPLLEEFFSQNAYSAELQSDQLWTDLDSSIFLNGTLSARDPNSFTNQLGAAVDNAQANFFKTLEIFGRQFDMQSLEDFGREGWERELSQAVRLGQPEVSSIDDIEDIGDVGLFLQYALAQSIPSLVSSLSSGMAGAVAGAGVGGPLGAGIGGVLGAFLGSAALNIGDVGSEMEEQLKARGMAGDMNDGLILGIGAAVSSLDAIGVAALTKPVMRPFIKEFGVEAAIDGLVKLGVLEGTAKAAVASIASEGLTEAAQEGLQMYSVAAATGTEIDPDEAANRIKTAAAIGAIGGGAIGSLSGSFGTVLQNEEIAQQQKNLEALEGVYRKLIVNGDLANNVSLQDWLGSQDPSELAYHLLDPNLHSFASVQNVNTMRGRAPGFGKILMEALGGQAITLLDRGAAISPAMDRIRNSISRRLGPNTMPGSDMMEETILTVGKWNTQYTAAMETLSEEEIARLPAVLRGDDRAEEGSTLDASVKKIQSLLTEIRDRAIAAGINVGFIQNYFPRFWNVRALQKDTELQSKLSEVFQQYGISPESASRVVAKVIKGQGVLTSLDFMDLERYETMDKFKAAMAEGKISRGLRLGTRPEGRVKAPSLEHTRVFPFIPDEVLAPFLVSNPTTVLSEYVRQASKRIIYAETFGPNEEILKAEVAEAINEMDLAGRPMTETELKRIYDLADAYLNLYKPITHPTTRRVNDVLTSYNYITLLPLAAMSMMQEPVIALQTGGKAFTKAVGQTVNAAFLQPMRRVFRWGKNGNAWTTAEEFREDMKSHAQAWDSATAARLAATYGGQPDVEPAFDTFEERLQKLTNFTFKANLLSPLTKWFRGLSFASGLNMLQIRAKRLAEQQAPVGSPRFRQWREEVVQLGLDPRELVDWHNRGAKKDDPYYQQKIKMGALRWVNQVVMHPTPVNRPMWMNNPHFRLLAQLKGFQTVFGNTVMKRWYQQIFRRGTARGVANAAAIAGMATMMTTLAVGMNELREMLTYWDEDGNPRNKNDDFLDHVLYGFERTGFLGAIQFGVDAANAHTFGASPVGAILGPSVGKADALISSLSAAVQGGSPEKLRSEMIKAIPGLSVSPKLREMIKDAF